MTQYPKEAATATLAYKSTESERAKDILTESAATGSGIDQNVQPTGNSVDSSEDVKDQEQEKISSSTSKHPQAIDQVSNGSDKDNATETSDSSNQSEPEKQYSINESEWALMNRNLQVLNILNKNRNDVPKLTGKLSFHQWFKGLKSFLSLHHPSAYDYLTDSTFTIPKNLVRPMNSFIDSFIHVTVDETAFYGYEDLVGKELYDAIYAEFSQLDVYDHVLMIEDIWDMYQTVQSIPDALRFLSHLDSRAFPEFQKVVLLGALRRKFPLIKECFDLLYDRSPHIKWTDLYFAILDRLESGMVFESTTDNPKGPRCGNCGKFGHTVSKCWHNPMNDEYKIPKKSKGKLNPKRLRH